MLLDDVSNYIAAESHVDRSIDSPSDFIETNIVGTFNMLEVASHFVQTIELRQAYKIACLEEIAFFKGWLLIEEVVKAAEAMGKNSYGKYLGEILAEKG